MVSCHVLIILPCNYFLFHFLFIDFYFLPFQIYSSVLFLLILLVFQCWLLPITQPLSSFHAKPIWNVTENWNKKKENCCLIWSFQMHFSPRYDYNFIDYHFLPHLHCLRWIWSLLFMWLMFWINEAQVFWPDFKNIVTVWLRIITLMALMVRHLFTHKSVWVKYSLNVTAHLSINSQRPYNRFSRNNKNKRRQNKQKNPQQKQPN